MAERDVAAGAATLIELCGGRTPSIAVVLGSGLGDAGVLGTPLGQLDYFDLPGFPHTAIEGHQGRVLASEVDGLILLMLQGRVHYYESGRADAMDLPLKTLKAAGCDTLLMTNAAGSLEADAGPGAMMLVTDHINFTGTNPLIGAARDGSAFVDMTQAYDPELRALMRQAGQELSMPLSEGVYACFSGPSFETPAEIRAAGILGANAVGMSLVPETILARHAGLRVVALSVITNFAAGISDEALSHQQTMRAAGAAASDVRALLDRFLGLYAAARSN